MYLKTILEKYNDKQVELYVDMDGVIADYDVGVASNYDTKRPLYDSIKKIEEISHMKNINLHILSITRKSEGINEKNIWLDKYAPFFKNRNIISREANNFEKSSILKLNFFKELDKKDRVIILIDDDPLILKTIKDELEEIVLLKDTVLVD